MSRSEDILVRGPKHLDELIVALAPAGVVNTTMTTVSDGMVVFQATPDLQVFVGTSDLDDERGQDFASWEFEIGFESRDAAARETAAREAFDVLARTTRYELALFKDDRSDLVATAGPQAA